MLSLPLPALSATPFPHPVTLCAGWTLYRALWIPVLASVAHPTWYWAWPRVSELLDEIGLRLFFLSSTSASPISLSGSYLPREKLSTYLNGPGPQNLIHVWPLVGRSLHSIIRCFPGYTCREPDHKWRSWNSTITLPWDAGISSSTCATHSYPILNFISCHLFA